MTGNENTIREIDEMLAVLYPPGKPGAAVAIARGGKILFHQGYGMANLELNVKIEPEMVFRIGSITKQFTSVSILILAEQGHINLRDNINLYLPDFPSQGHEVTVEHLLTHTSGIKNYTDLPEWLPLWRKDLSLDELIALFKDQPFDFEPGENFTYSNSGYILLGAIIEKVSGMKYAEFIQKTIFEPLGMTHSFYDNPDLVLAGRVSGYTRGLNGAVNAPYLSMSQPYAAGALAASVDDLVLWDWALYGKSLLAPATLSQAFVPYVLKNGETTGYGYGWAIAEHAGFQFIEHGGGINGFTCGAVRVPAEQIYVAILTNTDSPETPPDMLAFKIAAKLIGHPLEDPTPLDVAEDVLEEYTGVYQINEQDERLITLADKKLLSQRTGGMRLELIPYAVDMFFSKQDTARFVFIRAENGTVTSMKVIRRLGPAETAPRTGKPLPADRQAIRLESAQMDRFTGLFELAPGYVIELSLSDEQLYIQAPGQEKLKLFAASPKLVFASEVDLQVEYEFDDSGAVRSCLLQQGPNAYPLKKIG